jgi:hypothetical protein
LYDTGIDDQQRDPGCDVSLNIAMARGELDSVRCPPNASYERLRARHEAERRQLAGEALAEFLGNESWTPCVEHVDGEVSLGSGRRRWPAPFSQAPQFNEKTDKIAKYGLAGLILGGVGPGAAKLVKIGLLAKFWNVIVAALIAGKKAIALALVGAVAFAERLFGRRSKPQVAPPTAP